MNEEKKAVKHWNKTVFFHVEREHPGLSCGSE
jgi:hypothetical protein